MAGGEGEEVRFTNEQFRELMSRPAIRARNGASVAPEPIMTIAPSSDATKLNKTEQAYHEWLKRQDYQWVGVQCITLKLGDDCRYTPDFFCLDRHGELIAKEVKGFWRDDAKVKIKVAARMFPFIRFSVVMKTKDAWTHTPVKP